MSQSCINGHPMRMAIKGYFIHLRIPEQEPHHQIQFSVILWTPLFWERESFYSDADDTYRAHKHLGLITIEYQLSTFIYKVVNTPILTHSEFDPEIDTAQINLKKKKKQSRTLDQRGRRRKILIRRQLFQNNNNVKRSRIKFSNDYGLKSTRWLEKL